MPAVPGGRQRIFHLSIGWEIAVVSSFVIIIIAVVIVVVCQTYRKNTRIRGVELEDGIRSNRNEPITLSLISNKKKRRRNKARKTKVRDPDVTIDVINPESGEVEEDTMPLQKDIGTGGISEREQYSDIPKPIRYKSNSKIKDAGPKSVPRTNPFSDSTTTSDSAIKHFQRESP